MTGFTSRGRSPTVARVGVLVLVMLAVSSAMAPALGARVSASAHVCPTGYSIVPTAVGPLCAHDSADPLPATTRTSAVRIAQPRCYGDGVSGNRVQLLYVHATGSPVRAGIYERIVRKIVPAIEGLVRGRSRDQGQELGVRFHMPGCKLRVDIVELSAATMEPEPQVNEQTSRIIDELSSLGFDKGDRKYLVWVDSASAPNRPTNGPGVGPCGIGTTGIMDTAPLPNPFDQPTPTNYHNGIVALYALAFTSVTPLLGGTGCWGSGSTGADTEAHELFHTLGAVQLSAPNSNGYGHCTDVPDLMCYAERGVGVREVCTDARSKVLDCGGNDYFNANPLPGSYLATHWNTAKSSFLGGSPVDGVPVKFRRP